MKKHHDLIVKPADQSIPTGKCGTCKAQPESTALTQQPTGRKNVAVAPTPKVTASDSGKSPRGQRRRASHRNGKNRKPIYDSYVGSHPIAAVPVPDLMERIVDEENFFRAINEINSEPGKACGIDRKSVREVCEQLKASVDTRNLIMENIQYGCYRPNWVKVIQIPKPNGGVRTLGIATVKDRIVQRMILNAVEDYLPANAWSPYSYAFSRHKSVADAIAEVNRIREEGYKFAIKLDLKSFFDNVPHDRLLAKLKRHISDQRVVSLIRKFLTPVMQNSSGKLWINRIGSPQGSIISPWLTSKLYLDELDQELAARKLRFVRYADDITVFCHTHTAAKRAKDNLIAFVEQVLKCPVNHEKSEITDIGNLSLLGVALINGKWRIDRKKEKEYCALYLNGLRLYQRTNDDAVFKMVLQSMKSTIAYYKRIPGIETRKIKALESWAARKMLKTLLDMPNEPAAPDYLS